MATKMLSSFEVRGFCAFDQLKLTNLGRVNLIVGKNNVGKSSLLEALWVYANQGAPNILWSLLVDRNESEPFSFLGGSPRLTEDEIENQLKAVRSLFYGRKEKPEAQSISLGPVENGKNTLMIDYVMSAGREREKQASLFSDSDEDENEDVPALSIKFGNNNPMLVRLDRSLTKRFREIFIPFFRWKKYLCSRQRTFQCGDQPLLGQHHARSEGKGCAGFFADPGPQN